MKTLKKTFEETGLFTIIIILFALASICVFAGIKELHAKNPNDIEAPLPMPTNVSYSTIYYSGCKFVVFSNSSGSDIEVIRIE